MIPKHSNVLLLMSMVLRTTVTTSDSVQKPPRIYLVGFEDNEMQGIEIWISHEMHLFWPFEESPQTNNMYLRFISVIFADHNLNQVFICIFKMKVVIID